MDVNKIDPEITSPGCSRNGILKEILTQFNLTWPMCLAMMFQYLLKPVSISFCGHLGTTELAAVCMAISVICIVVMGIGQGLAFGGATFFAQTYGSDQKKNVGIYLQKGIIFMVLWSLPMIGFLINLEDLLLLIGQNPDVARLTQVYINYFLPGTWAYFSIMMVIRYLVCQNKIYPVMVVSIVGFVASIALNFGLVTKARFGLRGSAMAFSLTYYLELFLYIVYIISTGLYKETWTRWSFTCLQNWGEFSRITTFSIVLNVCYWTATEIGTYTAGMISILALSVFSISFQMEVISCSVFEALGGVCAARMGQFLGANKPKLAAYTAHVALIFALVISIVLAVLCYLLKYYIPQIFTSNKSVIDFSASVLQLTAIFLGFEGIGLTGIGILRGAGMQAKGSIVILVAWFGIAWPIGIPIMFYTKLGLYGLWCSFIIGMLFQDIFIVISIFKINWKAQSELAVKRATVASTKISETSKLLSHTHNNIGEKRYVTSDCSNSKDQQNALKPKSRNKLVIKRLLILVMFGLPLVLGSIKRLTVIREDSSFDNGVNKSETIDPAYIMNVTYTHYDATTTNIFDNKL